MILYTLVFLQVFEAPMVLSFQPFFRWFSGALLIHALRLGAYGSLCSDLSQLFCHHAATELRCEGNALVGRIELHFDRWIDHGNLWLFEDENSEKLSFSGEKAGGKLTLFFPCRQKYTYTYGSFWKERFDKVIRFAQIRIAQMSREPTELTSGGVGRRLPEAGTFGLRPISGRKPPWVVCLGGKELKTLDDLEGKSKFKRYTIDGYKIFL